jgi:hypothetical protein
MDTLAALKGDLARIHKSLTIWFNGIVGTIALYLPDVLDLMPQLREYVSEPNYKTWMLVLLIGNALLRFKTTQPLRDK